MVEPLAKVDLDPSVTRLGLGRIVVGYRMSRTKAMDLDAPRIDAMLFQPASAPARALGG
jgi:hypothetical protein